MSRNPDWQTADGAVTLYHGDCLAVLADLPAGSVDTVITDPPYHLSDASRHGSPRVQGNGAHGRFRVGERGFMGKTWDGGGIAFDPATWSAVLRVAKPGAFLLAFGGTRTSHRLACAIEDAGWEIRDTLCWLYGQGFPKSLDVSKAIDKAAGAERGRGGKKVSADGTVHHNSRKHHNGYQRPFMDDPDWQGIYESLPATGAAAEWSGWGTALKPAWEPIIVAMKPLDGTFAQNALAHGVAGLHIDGARIAAGNGDYDHPGSDELTNTPQGTCFGCCPTKSKQSAPHGSGRWPANVVLSHLPGCRCVGRKRVKGVPCGPAAGTVGPGFRGGWKCNKPFDYLAPDGTEEVEAWECEEGCPVRLLDEQSGEKMHAAGFATDGKHCASKSATSMFGRGGPGTPAPRVGDSGGASRFFYCAKASRSERGEGNDHPTVKPLDLIEWLCRLTATPTHGTVLDPFLGSATTALACLNTGRQCIGIEKDPEYFDIAVNRIVAELGRQPLLEPSAPAKQQTCPEVVP